MPAPDPRDSSTIDALDAQITRAIQLSPRASFGQMADVLGVAEQTVARRYRRLRRDGLMRVTVAIEPRSIGVTVWMVRVRCRPENAGPIADALGRRDDVSWVSILSAGWEVAFNLRSATESETDELLTRLLPRAAPVLDVSAAAVMHTFVGGAPTDWEGWRDVLSRDQADALVSTRIPATTDRGPVELSPGDRALVERLSHDGRSPYSSLARTLGSTPGQVTRRIQTLVSSGVIYFDVDLAPAATGRFLSALLWLTVAPGRLRAVGDALAEHPDVPFAAAVTGASNMIASVAAVDVPGLYDFVVTVLADLDGVTGYELAPMTRRIKHAGSLVSGDRLAPPPVASR
ncbi:Lrp/AsnC family transcriptional regulator [Gordonia sp. DT101]|uniref:Lrp/AsnC family transcriptional regulator n=1 Tax=Gordonia sp. DT101 TaxID=3416545 RepID=UPI003CF27869